MGDRELIDVNFYLPCLNLTGRRCLVVGGGPIAFEKVSGLLDCDAAVRVIAREASPGIKELDSQGRIDLAERDYQSADLDDCFLVIAATSDTSVNRRVFGDAEARSMLVNVVDVPELCNFILPAIHRDPPLAIAVSTSGASPALAKRIRREIASTVGPSYARLAKILFDLREWAKSELPDYRARKDFFESIVLGDPDPVKLLDAGDEEAVRDLIELRKKEAQAPGDSPSP